MSTIKLANSDLVAIVDDDMVDYLNQWTWKLVGGGYAGRATRVGSTKDHAQVIMLHRVVNNTPDNLITDHINHNILDNRKSNLRSVTHAQNMANRRVNKNSKSGIKGVTYDRFESRIKRWKASILDNGTRITIGHYMTKEEAADAFNEYAVKIRGQYAVAVGVED